MYTHYIAGVPKHPDFGHAVYVAEKLRQSLPNWSYEVVAKTEEEYPNWLRKFCHEEKWKIDKNPIVWMRRSNSLSPRKLIGGINEFFEMINEKYNIDTRLDSNTKREIALDNEERMKFMLPEKRLVPLPPLTPRKVCVTGVPSNGYMIAELMQLEELKTKDGITICLHHNDPDKYEGLIKLKNDLCNAEFNVRGHNAVMVVTKIEECLKNCDLLIVIGSLKREKKDNQHLWHNRNYDAMKSLASVLNLYCPEQCKVMLMGMDLVCFNLSVVAEYTYKVHIYNFVGVTAHYGMKTVPAISKATGIPIRKLQYPPVWGFVNSFKHVDKKRTRFVSPSKRPENRNENHGYACHNDNVKYLGSMLLQYMANLNIVEEANSTNWEEEEYPTDCLPEVRAAVDLLTEWFASKKTMKTISAAVFSDGTFDLPFGMFLSQPVHMENGEWKPNHEIPPPDHQILMDIVSKTKKMVFEYNLGSRFNVQKTNSDESCIDSL